MCPVDYNARACTERRAGVVSHARTAATQYLDNRILVTLASRL